MGRKAVQDPRVGRAFQGKDGLVRWITHRSVRGLYTVRWRDDAGCWNFGGTTRAESWPGSRLDGEEVPAPQPGDTIQVIGALGTRDERVV